MVANDTGPRGSGWLIARLTLVGVVALGVAVAPVSASVVLDGAVVHAADQSETTAEPGENETTVIASNQSVGAVFVGPRLEFEPPGEQRVPGNGEWVTVYKTPVFAESQYGWYNEYYEQLDWVDPEAEVPVVLSTFTTAATEADLGAQRNYDDRLEWRFGSYDADTGTWTRRTDGETRGGDTHVVDIRERLDYEMEDLVGNEMRLEMRVAEADGFLDNDEVFLDPPTITVCTCVYQANRTYSFDLSESSLERIKGPATVAFTVDRADGMTSAIPLSLRVNGHTVTNVTEAGTHTATVNASLLTAGENTVEFWIPNPSEEREIAAGYVVESSEVHVQRQPAIGLETNVSRNGTTVQVSYEVENDRESAITGVQLTQNGVPEHWQVRDHSDDGGTWLPDDQGWFWQTIGANETRTTTVTFSAPNETAAQQFEITATVSDASGHETTATVQQSPPEPSTPPLDLRLTSAHDESMAPNETLTLAFEVANTNASALSGVELDVGGSGDEWPLVSHNESRSIWVDGERMWIWQSIEANATETVSVTLRVPEETTAGTYTVPAAVTDAHGHTDTVNATITVANDR